jgi:hypothetical protein
LYEKKNFRRGLHYPCLHTQNAASQLERTINRWAGEVLRLAPAPPATLQDAALADVAGAGDNALFTEARPMMVQSLLRHAMSEAISEGIINCLIVTSSAEANIQITRIHEHLFARKCLSHPLLLTLCEEILSLKTEKCKTAMGETKPVSPIAVLHFSFFSVSIPSGFAFPFSTLFLLLDVHSFPTSYHSSKAENKCS